MYSLSRNEKEMTCKERCKNCGHMTDCDSGCDINCPMCGSRRDYGEIKVKQEATGKA